MSPSIPSILPKILIVDDIAANRLALRIVLKGIDAELLEADNGFDALSLSLEEEFALILLDVQMPDMDGFEVCEQLRANPQTADTPVIFVTAANKADEDRVHGYLKGATDYLSKPVNDQILRAKTQAFLRMYRQNRELSDALQAAQAADRAKDAFLANISHELRTPLNVVIGMTELARRQSREPLQRNYLDKVMSAGQTLAHLIDDLLDLSKIVAGRLEFERTTFRLRHVIARCSSAMAFRATEKGLRLIEHIDDDAPDIVVGDPLRIEQVLMNLLSNAIKFTAAGQIELRIGVREREAERVCLTIAIEDSGIGMSAEEMALLFKPFSQADPTMSRKYGGTGLGLTICKHLAETMGGEIGATSRKDHGSTFHVALWLGLGQEDDLPAAEATAMEETPLRYRDVHILVAEDQALNREIVEALLSSVGITPHMVANGREALDVLMQRGPTAFDLVLMDVQMPIMDGLSATRAVRNQAGFESLPILAFTAHTMEHERAIGAQAGMSDHIGKPIDHRLFYRTLAKWIPTAKHAMATHDEETACADCPAISKLCKIDGLSSATGIANFAGNEARFLHWLKDFVTAAPEMTLQIRRSLVEGSIEAARQTTHAFKGRVGMLGMKELYTLIVELENAIKCDEPPLPWLERAHHAVDDLCRQIRQALGPVAATAEPAPAIAAAAPPGSPTAAPPACVQRLLEMLASGDGGSEAMIDVCLFELRRTDWVPSLQAARLKLKQFDFNGAQEILAPGIPAASS